MSCELSAQQTIHMKYQALFSLKNKGKKSECCLYQFTISVIVCLCMYVLVKYSFWIAVRPVFAKKTLLLAFRL